MVDNTKTQKNGSLSMKKTWQWLSIFLSALLFLTTIYQTAQGQVSQDELFSPTENFKEKNIHPEKVVLWTNPSARSYQDGYTIVTLRLNTIDNFAVYQTKLWFTDVYGLSAVGIKTPQGKTISDPLSEKKVKVYDQGIFEILFQSTTPILDDTFSFNVKFIGCTSRICLFPYTKTISATNTTIGANLSSEEKKTFAPPLSFYPDSQDNLPLSSEAGNLGELESSLSEDFAEKITKGNMSLLLLLLIAFLGGLLTNLTPCVYPLIPITIRILANQRKSPFLVSSAYGLGIVVTYTTLGSIAVLGNNVFGQMMSDPWVNLLIALIMALLAISMLGYGQYSWLQNLGSKLQISQKGPLNALLMGLGAGFVASPCAGPILGAFLTYIATSEYAEKGVVLIFAYSCGFALPYVFLATVATKLNHIKLAPQWQTVAKFLFSGIMFTLCFYYLRIPFYTVTKLFTPWSLHVAAISGVLMALTGGYTFYRLKDKEVTSLLIAPSLFFGLFLFSLIQGTTHWRSAEARQLNWQSDLKEALILSEKTKRPILVDLWAEWCESCKEMDIKTFSNPQIKKALVQNQWILVKIDLTNTTDKTDEILQKYKVQGIPTLIILTPYTEPKSRLLSGFVGPKKLMNTLRGFTKEKT